MFLKWLIGGFLDFRFSYAYVQVSNWVPAPRRRKRCYDWYPLSLWFAGGGVKEWWCGALFAKQSLQIPFNFPSICVLNSCCNWSTCFILFSRINSVACQRSYIFQFTPLQLTRLFSVSAVHLPVSPMASPLPQSTASTIPRRDSSPSSSQVCWPTAFEKKNDLGILKSDSRFPFERYT